MSNDQRDQIQMIDANQQARLDEARAQQQRTRDRIKSMADDSFAKWLQTELTKNDLDEHCSW